jgi:hypothetical protein
VFPAWECSFDLVRFFQRFDSAELEHGFAAGVGGIHAALFVFCCVKCEMTFDFGVEFAIAAMLAEKSGAAD